MADPAMIAVRFALYAVLAAAFGLPLFALQALRGGERVVGTALRFRVGIVAAAGAGLAFSALWLALLAASMGDTPLAGVTGETVALLIDGTAIGAAWTARMAALTLMLPVASLGGRAPRTAFGLLAVAGAVALGSLAWTGHGAMDEGVRGWVHLLADLAHLLAAGAWIGALAAFLRFTFARAPDPVLAQRVLHGFASTGTLLVLLLLGTGLVNGWVLVGPDHLAALVTDDYGRLLLIKLALFAAMLALAAANRFRHTPALRATVDDPVRALAGLRRSLLAETTAALAILVLVAWLGMLSPPASA
ncbi:copper homeostasis membrane protein CopD [Sphingomonas solaris]|uniref:Copper homeostasis membrane protein CopD n=1 Tax=Alterirhizorhabdus solaris TaxID=2529389 RepID=A0A558R4D7_9SPHN|nr:copper homeostasis membrane protein CopD [Sphingomonas solaris]TVV74253.1 copper homeostasis membrane protein CopD [Sphingomonas solaris]